MQKESNIGFEQIKRRLDRALIDVANAKLVINNDDTGAYCLAYDAMLQAGIALILSCGYRPKVAGFHKTIVESARGLLGEEFAVIVKKFDQMRRNRHEAIYDIGTISSIEAQDAIKSAEGFLVEIKKYITRQDPQKNLFS